jgi:hypothetical protein
MNISKTIMTAIVAGPIGICFSSFSAQAETCKVMDPTGTPLNVRLQPNGKIVAKIRNKRVVYLQSITRDENGKQWVLVSMKNNGGEMVLGWVLREFVSCY